MKKLCESCGMPMFKYMNGREKDGSISQDYCKYCYYNGEFTRDLTMDEMMEICVRSMVGNDENMTEDRAKELMSGLLSKLKRWI